MSAAAWGASATALALFLLVLVLVLARRLRRSKAALRAQPDYRAPAYTDGLTGLPNRRAFQDALDALEGSGRTICVAMLDVDGLKRTNDIQGHLAGDRLLCRAGELLTALCAPEYQVYRIGGDEFALLGADQTPETAERRLTGLRPRLRADGLSLSLGWACGRAAAPGDLARLRELSDRAMYADKQAHGRLSR